MPEPDGPVDLDDERLNAVLEAVGGGGSLDLSDAVVEAGELAAVLERAPVDELDHPVLTGADFEGACFEGDTDFDGVVFRGGANFEGAVFAGRVRFAKARFAGAARFADARFEREATFEEAHIEGDAGFTESTFRDDAQFDHVCVGGEARFDEAAFAGDVRFTAARIRGEASFNATAFDDDAHFDRAEFSELYARKARFGGDVWFDDATFVRRAWFSEARFAGGAWFANARFGEHARFNRVAFETARDIGPLAVLEELSFAEADFSLPVRIEAVARRATWQAARFRSGGDLSLGWAEVNLERSEFGGPSLIAALPAERAVRLDALLVAQGWASLSGRTASDGTHRASSLCAAPSSPSSRCPRSTCGRARSTGPRAWSGCGSSACASPRARRRAPGTGHGAGPAGRPWPRSTGGATGMAPGAGTGRRPGRRTGSSGPTRRAPRS